MYLHLGGDVVVPIREIIGIFDSRLLEGNDDNRRFVEVARTQGRIRSEVPPGGCKAVVVTTTGVYTSAISSLTLQKRVTHVQWGLQEGGNAGLT
ncbi:MAG TPA: extracellular matrix/biofilm biosynthesis regulator RemA family protein [bacterium]|nr:extracellular matrix/biofilm biosynthesis regulator RemA family protein [bacterium]